MCFSDGMTVFIHRFMGALALDRDAFEEIEADQHANMQSVLVVSAVCLAAGFAAMVSGRAGLGAWVSGVIISLGAWVVWAGFIASVGTITLREPQTRSNLPELLRVLGFATAPGVFVALAALAPAAPLGIGLVAIWVLAASVVAVRQALDYLDLRRALAVCVIASLVAASLVALVSVLLTRTVN